MGKFSQSPSSKFIGLKRERDFWADVLWSGDESQSSVNQTFTGNQSLSS